MCMPLSSWWPLIKTINEFTPLLKILCHLSLTSNLCLQSGMAHKFFVSFYMPRVQKETQKDWQQEVMQDNLSYNAEACRWPQLFCSKQCHRSTISCPYTGVLNVHTGINLKYRSATYTSFHPGLHHPTHAALSGSWSIWWLGRLLRGIYVQAAA